MSSDEETAAREGRLSGSGIPLSEAARTVLQRLQIRPAGIDELAADIRRNKLLSLNKGRIMATWGEGEWRRKKGRNTPFWDDISAGRLAEDILAQLQVHGLAARDGELWHLAEGFDPRRRYVILAKDGKAVTHIRLAEAEVRESKSKLSEARFGVISAQQLARDAGAETQEIRELFAALLRLLDNESILSERARKKPGRQPRVVTLDQPPDQPNLLVKCVKCPDDAPPKPQTREFYEVYLSQAAIGVKKWYWRRDCKTCRQRRKITEKSRAQEDAVREMILAFLAEHHYLPTVRQVARQTGLHSNAARYAWKRLAKQEEGFPAVPAVLRESLCLPQGIPLILFPEEPLGQADRQVGLSEGYVPLDAFTDSNQVFHSFVTTESSLQAFNFPGITDDKHRNKLLTSAL